MLLTKLFWLITFNTQFFAVFCLGYKFLWDILLLVCFISVIFSSFPLPSKIQVVRFKRCAVVCCADWAAEPRHFWQWWPPLPPTRPLSKSSLSTESGWPTSSRQGLKSDLYLWQWWSWCLCFIFDPKCCPPAGWSNQWQFIWSSLTCSRFFSCTSQPWSLTVLAYCL